MSIISWIVLLLCPLVGMSLYALSMPNPASAVHWIDGLAYSSLLLFMLGGVLLIRNGNFFRAFWESCSRFYAALRKREAYLRELEGRGKRARYARKEIPHLPVLLVAAGGFLLSLVLSVLSLP